MRTKTVLVLVSCTCIYTYLGDNEKTDCYPASCHTDHAMDSLVQQYECCIPQSDHARRDSSDICPGSWLKKGHTTRHARPAIGSLGFGETLQWAWRTSSRAVSLNTGKFFSKICQPVKTTNNLEIITCILPSALAKQVRPLSNPINMETVGLGITIMFHFSAWHPVIEKGDGFDHDQKPMLSFLPEGNRGACATHRLPSKQRVVPRQSKRFGRQVVEGNRKVAQAKP